MSVKKSLGPVLLGASSLAYGSIGGALFIEGGVGVNSGCVKYRQNDVSSLIDRSRLFYGVARIDPDEGNFSKTFLKTAPQGSINLGGYISVPGISSSAFTFGVMVGGAFSEMRGSCDYTLSHFTGIHAAVAATRAIMTPTPPMTGTAAIVIPVSSLPSRVIIPQNAVNSTIAIPSLTVAGGGTVPSTRVSGNIAIPSLAVSGDVTMPSTGVSGHLNIPSTTISGSVVINQGALASSNPTNLTLNQAINLSGNTDGGSINPQIIRVNGSSAPLYLNLYSQQIGLGEYLIQAIGLSSSPNTATVTVESGNQAISATLTTPTLTIPPSSVPVPIPTGTVFRVNSFSLPASNTTLSNSISGTTTEIPNVALQNGTTNPVSTTVTNGTTAALTTTDGEAIQQGATDPIYTTMTGSTNPETVTDIVRGPNGDVSLSGTDVAVPSSQVTLSNGHVVTIPSHMMDIPSQLVDVPPVGGFPVYQTIVTIGFQGRGYFNIPFELGLRVGKVHIVGRVGYSSHLIKVSIQSTQGEGLTFPMNKVPCVMAGGGISFNVTPSLSIGGIVQAHRGHFKIQGSFGQAKDFSLKKTLKAFEVQVNFRWAIPIF